LCGWGEYFGLEDADDESGGERKMNINTVVTTVGDLLNDQMRYKVPIFQRSFAWEKTEVAEFTEDLFNMCGYHKRETDYFLGSMVFTPHEDDRKTKILDGQQRFATFLLFLAALRDVLLESGGKEETKVRIDELNRMIFRRDPITLMENVKLELNREDKVFFEEIVMHGVVPEPKYVSHKRLRGAYNSLKSAIACKLDKKKEKFIQMLLDAFLRKFKIIKIEVDSDINAHIIFETLNDRGLDLSVGDLVKNYIFALGSDRGRDLGLLVERWQELVDQVGDHNVTTFLRHFWISRYELVRKDGLYKALKDKVKVQNVKSVLGELSREAAVYANLITPTHEFWGDPELESQLEELNVLKVQQVYVLLLGLHNKMGSDKRAFRRMVKVLTNFSFRYSTICGLNPNELERVYSRLSLDVRKKAVSKEEVIKELRRRAPSKTTFLEAFRDFETKSSKLARHILTAISDYLLKRAGQEERETRAKRINLEHIIPKKLNKKWREFFQDRNVDAEKVIHKIGNMTILLEEYNRAIANKFFDKKREMYKKSTLPINQELKKYQEFGKAQVDERQTKFGKIAEALWSVK